MWSATTAPDGDRQRFRWSAFVWSPPPESNRRPHPYHGTTGNRCADHRLPGSRPTVGAKVIGSLSAKLCALPQAMHWPSRRSHKSRSRPRAQHLFPLNPGIYPAAPPVGALLGSAHPIVSLLRPAQAIAPRTMNRRRHTGCSRRRPLTLWRGRLLGPSSPYPADLRGCLRQTDALQPFGAPSGGQSRANPG
jgi:hypothetical protein